MKRHAPQRESVSRARLVELFIYEPESGAFVRRCSISNQHAGDVSGSKHCRGYVSVCIDSRAYLAHRLAWLYVHGEWPAHQLDHIDGNRANNAIANLRQATAAQNGQNKRKASGFGSSGLLGVTWDKVNLLWRAKIKVNGRSLCLGRFTGKHEAHEAYLAAKRQLHPFGTL